MLNFRPTEILFLQQLKHPFPMQNVFKQKSTLLVDGQQLTGDGRNIKYGCRVG